MIGRVPSPALPDLHPALRLAGPVRPLAGLQGHRAAGAAARGCRAAPYHAQAPAGLGRSRGPRRADPAPARQPADAPAGHTRHRAAVAPPPRHTEVDLSAPDGPAAGQCRDRRADRAACHREPRLGVPAHPGRASEAWSSGRRVHRPTGSQGPENTPGTPSDTPTRPGASSCTRKPP
jgi:hypothetical protein